MKGIIYCFKGINNNLIYIGSSKDSLNIRKSKHIYDSKHEKRMKPVHKIINSNGGFDNFQMKVLKEVDDIKLLHLIEKKIIQDYKNNINYKLMNTHQYNVF